MIFLSASIPKKNRAAKYYNTADRIAIREAVKALAAVVLPLQRLVWGGHPAISPLIKYVLERQEIDATSRVLLYQSEFFHGSYYEHNAAFGEIIETEKLSSKKQSLLLMRKKMIGDHPFSAGVFIGGMEGVEEEYKLFRKMQPNVPVYPIASTGAAAKILFDEDPPDQFAEQLLEEHGYYALFKQLFGELKSDFVIA